MEEQKGDANTRTEVGCPLEPSAAAAATEPGKQRKKRKNKIQTIKKLVLHNNIRA